MTLVFFVLLLSQVQVERIECKFLNPNHLSEEIIVKKLLISVILFFICVPAFAWVDTAWVRRYNGPGNDLDVANAIAIDGSGNVYVTGHRTYLGSISEYVTIKYDPEGNMVWLKKYSGPGSGWDEAIAIELDGSGNVYVTGNSTDTLTDSDYATLKYDSLGVWRWVKRYNGPANSWDAPQAMTLDNSGNVYVTGYSQGSETDIDYATIKYYPDGATAWVARYNGPRNSWDWAYGIAVDGSGFVYVTGGSEGMGTGMDFATIKYTPDGDTVWVRRYDGPASAGDRATAIAVDPYGNAYVTGQSFDTLSDNDYLTIKYYQNGDTAWVRRYNCPNGNGPDEPHAIIVDADGYVYVTGGFATSSG